LKEAVCSFLKITVSLKETVCTFLKTVVSLKEAVCSFLKTTVFLKETVCFFLKTVVLKRTQGGNYSEKARIKTYCLIIFCTPSFVFTKSTDGYELISKVVFP
jgi:hypothetical protein